MSIIITVLLLGIIVFIHEFGHFITAKMFHMPVLEFAVGMGPKLISKKIKTTVYSIRAIPFGGFVSIDGMEVEAENEVENGFNTQNPLKRLIVLSAGVFMNFLSGLGFFIVQNSDGFSFNFLKYSRFLSFCGLSLIFGGLLIVFSYITCLKKHFVFSIISDCLGFLISMLALFFICRHADSAGWFNNAYNSSFSHLLFLRIFPSVIPFIICLALSVIQLFGSVNSPRSTKNH